MKHCFQSIDGPYIILKQYSNSDFVNEVALPVLLHSLQDFSEHMHSTSNGYLLGVVFLAL